VKNLLGSPWSSCISPDFSLFFLSFVYSCIIVAKAQDVCSTAYGPRPTGGSTGPRPTDEVRFSGGNTKNSTLDNDAIIGGFCGVNITNNGLWWSIEGTGLRMRATSCNDRTKIKVKLSVFTGTCDALRCIGGGEEQDFGCVRGAESSAGEWESLSTAYDFDTFEGQIYYILVQQASAEAGVVWMGFSPALEPPNNACYDAVGPVPRDGITTVYGDSLQSNLDAPAAGFCGTNQGQYPGVWYQVFGTGGRITLEACSEFNTDGFEFSVYNGFRCEDSSLTCVTSGTTYTTKSDPDKCTFQNLVGTNGENSVVRPMTTFSFDTKDRDRYYILVNFAAPSTLTPTAPFRFWVDDGEDGNAGSGGTTGIQFSVGGGDVDDGDGDGNDGDGDGDGGNGSGAKSMFAMGLSAVVAFAAPAVMLLAM
jgi:hypothetical protein